MTDREVAEERRRTAQEEVRVYLAACEISLRVLLAARPCSRCGSTDPSDGRQFFTARTFYKTIIAGAIATLHGHPAAERFLASTGTIVVCKLCLEKLQANGSWAAVLAARAESKKETEHA